jgi:hypothetical protein
MAGHGALDAGIGVRLLVSQPGRGERNVFHRLRSGWSWVRIPPGSQRGTCSSVVRAPKKARFVCSRPTFCLSAGGDGLRFIAYLAGNVGSIPPSVPLEGWASSNRGHLNKREPFVPWHPDLGGAYERLPKTFAPANPPARSADRAAGNCRWDDLSVRRHAAATMRPYGLKRNWNAVEDVGKWGRAKRARTHRKDTKRIRRRMRRILRRVDDYD